MNRRTFLSALAASAGVIVLPEPRRVYSFPSATWLERQSRILPPLTFTAQLAGRVYDAQSVSIRFGGVRVETADGFEFDGHLYTVPRDGHEAIKRTVASALRRHQNYMSLEAIRSVVIRGKVSV